MDTSPLPHKAPFVAQVEVEIHSPTPVPTPDDVMMFESPLEAQTQVVQQTLEVPKPAVAE